MVAGFVAYNIFVALRVNLSVTIIVMVSSTYPQELETVASTVSNNSLFGLRNNNSTHADDHDDNVRRANHKFSWHIYKNSIII